MGGPPQSRTDGGGSSGTGCRGGGERSLHPPALNRRWQSLFLLTRLLSRRDASLCYYPPPRLWRLADVKQMCFRVCQLAPVLKVLSGVIIGRRISQSVPVPSPTARFLPSPCCCGCRTQGVVCFSFDLRIADQRTQRCENSSNYVQPFPRCPPPRLQFYKRMIHLN